MIVGRRRLTPYLLLIPGMIWLAIFYLVPLVQLAAVSLQSPFPGFPGYYYRDWNIGNYGTALSSFSGHFLRSLL